MRGNRGKSELYKREFRTLVCRDDPSIKVQQSQENALIVNYTERGKGEDERLRRTVQIFLTFENQS